MDELVHQHPIVRQRAARLYEGAFLPADQEAPWSARMRERDPAARRAILAEVRKRFKKRLEAHFHQDFGMGVANTMTMSAQMALPNWVRARGMAVYQMALMGGSAAGAALWGQVAGRFDIRTALMTAAAAGLLALLATRRLRLQGEHGEDLSPVPAQPVPEPAFDFEPEQGPVMVTVEYLIDPARARDFSAVMDLTRLARMRQGALSWGLFRDTAQPGRYIEYFVDENWLEHRRRLERFTAFDAGLRDARRRIDDVVAARTRTLTVVIEALGDPQNVNAVLRTCEAFGVQELHVVEGPMKVYDPNKKISQNADKWLEVVRWRSTRECLEHLKGRGFRIFATRLGDGRDVVGLHAAVHLQSHILEKAGAIQGTNGRCRAGVVHGVANFDRQIAEHRTRFGTLYAFDADILDDKGLDSPGSRTV